MQLAPSIGSPAVRLDARLGLVSRRWLLVLAYLVALAPALVTGLTQPIWSRVDEAQHADVLDQYVHGVYPVEGVTTIRQPIVNVMQDTGIFRWNQPGILPLPSQLDAGTFTSVPAYLTGYARDLWVRRHVWWFSYEAVQPPAFYLLAAPVWGAASALADPFTAIYAVRVLNALILAALAPLVLGIAWLLFPRRPGIAAGSALMVSALPGLVLNGTQISNDASAAVAGGLLTLLLLKALRAGWTWRWSAGVGAALGLAVLCKLTAVGLAGAVAVALAWPVLRGGAGWRRQVRPALITGGVAAAVVAPWLAVNLAVYGSPLPTRAGDQLLGAVFPPSVPTPGFILGSARNAFMTFWAGEPVDQVPGDAVTALVMLAWVVASVLGLRRMLRRGEAGDRAGLVWVVAAAVIGEVVWAGTTLLVSGVGGYTPGRYLYPAVAPAVVLTVAGLWYLVRSRRLRLGAMALFLLLASVNLGGLAAGVTGYAQADRSGPSSSARHEQVDVSGSFGGVAIRVRQVLNDPAQNALWLDIQLSNSADTGADWWPSPWVSTDGGATHMLGDYGGSSPFPETLPPHSVYYGWIKIPVTDTLDLARPLRVHFLDVATDGYRHLGTILLWLPPAPR